MHLSMRILVHLADIAEHAGTSYSMFTVKYVFLQGSNGPQDTKWTRFIDHSS